ncbi:hypothetical protein [Candidatus Methylacidithermus pantelleriae]|uniref:Uncharacterized protein n=1 Tax=Candidatus Methylacidithermus pantelleriae TaxID=2744239 RepID=A0A8J2BVH9_9BACT|nr:hypothetical protein [Candidatus Methylacidithermus pantelleriae]CAF0703937.1 hypothetical protein MPNT_60143 [Candidatus Methylacidithermus pantelleriae]
MPTGTVIVYAEAASPDGVELFRAGVQAPMNQRIETGSWLGLSKFALKQSVVDCQGRQGRRL